MTGADRQNGPGGKERLTVMAGEVAAVCISEKKEQPSKISEAVTL